MIDFDNNRVFWIVFSKYDNLNGGIRGIVEIKSGALLILCG